MGERLAGGNLAVVLLVNSLATGAVLVALIASFAGISGAHFNPVVSLVEALLGRMTLAIFALHVAAQVLGGVLGTFTAHWMFALPSVTLSEHVRTGPAQWWSEVVAT